MPMLAATARLLYATLPPRHYARYQIIDDKSLSCFATPTMLPRFSTEQQALLYAA